MHENAHKTRAARRPEGAAGDLLANRRAAFALWGLPTVALVVAIGLEGAAKGALWTVALAWLGIACLWNAWRSGRRHCYLTGPYFLALAAVAALYGSGLLPLGERGWMLIGTALGAGALLLIHLPERRWGKYIRRTDEGTQERAPPPPLTVRPDITDSRNHP